MIFFDIEIRSTESKGRGMFALEDIPAYQIIETAPVIVMSAEERKLLDQTLNVRKPRARAVCPLSLFLFSFWFLKESK